MRAVENSALPPILSRKCCCVPGSRWGFTRLGARCSVLVTWERIASGQKKIEAKEQCNTTVQVHMELNEGKDDLVDLMAILKLLEHITQIQRHYKLQDLVVKKWKKDLTLNLATKPLMIMNKQKIFTSLCWARSHWLLLIFRSRWGTSILI